MNLVIGGANIHLARAGEDWSANHSRTDFGLHGTLCPHGGFLYPLLRWGASPTFRFSRNPTCAYSVREMVGDQLAGSTWAIAICLGAPSS
jgi:hypothetical protein